MVRRRAQRYRMLSVAALAVLIAAGVGWRMSVEGQAAFVERVVNQSERYVRELARKVNFR